MQYINENLPAELNISLRKVINGMIDDELNDDQDDDDDDGEIHAFARIFVKCLG